MNERLARRAAESLARLTYAEIIAAKERYRQRYRLPLDDVLHVFDTAIMLKDDLE